VQPFIFNAQFEAETIFQKLDPRFEPLVSVVGIPKDSKRKKIGVGPKNTPFQPDSFRNVFSRASQLEQEDPESESRWMPDPTHGWTEAHERLQKAKERKIRVRALRRAMIEALNVAQGNSGYATYCGWPVQYDDDEVTLILQLQKDVHDDYYHLKKGAYRDRGGFHEYRLERSLIDAVASEFLTEMAKELMTEHPGEGWRIIKDQENLFLKSAKALMYTPAIAGGNQGEIISACPIVGGSLISSRGQAYDSPR
jgi:hypothetical protein